MPSSVQPAALQTFHKRSGVDKMTDVEQSSQPWHSSTRPRHFHSLSHRCLDNKWQRNYYFFNIYRIQQTNVSPSSSLILIEGGPLTFSVDANRSGHSLPLSCLSLLNSRYLFFHTMEQTSKGAFFPTQWLWIPEKPCAPPSSSHLSLSGPTCNAGKRRLTQIESVFWQEKNTRQS